MFGGPPPGYVPSKTELDLRERMVPSEDQVKIAVAMLNAMSPETYCVLVPIAFPGKDHGIWVIGQAIEYPPGFWLARDNGWNGPESVAQARNLAEDAALRHLEDRAGTPGYAYIYRDGHAAMFEGFSRAEGVAGGRAAAAGSEPG